jgi:phosphoribosylformimino-5-aminoimidazole carboxamide ribotide isomerase
MLIPSIDLMGGRIVQLVQGEKLKLAFDDFEYWINRFSDYPVVQLIDLDAAMRQGDNRSLIEKIAGRLPCQVGGGIHSVRRAQEIIEAGARRIIVGSALFRSNPAPTLVNTEFAAELAAAVGVEHIVAGIDTKQGQVAVKGWKEQVALTPDEALAELERYCSAFLYTHIDKEGTMQGFPIDIAARLKQKTSRQLIVAGGIREQQEIDTLDAMGIDAVAGMAVYMGALKA